MINKQYNLYNFEALFRDFLLAGIVSSQESAKNKISKQLSSVSIKNYLSDLRHFLGWLISDLQFHNQTLMIDEKNIIDFINHTTILNYRLYLSDNSLPIKTVNRRLSTIRKFCSFCISQGWMKENPGKKIKNQKLKSKITYQNSKIKTVMEQFRQNIIKSDESDQTDIIIQDINEFISFSDIKL